MQKPNVNYFNLFLYAALVILGAETAFLIKQNKDLKAQLEHGSQPLVSLKAGDKVEPFTYFKLTGDSTQVSYASQDKETMLWFFTTTCPACKKNVEIWKDLYAKNELSHRYNIIPISLDSIEASKKYVAEMKLPYEINALNRRRDVPEKYKVMNVPQTIVVGKDGIVKDVVVGVIKSEDKDKLIQAAF